MNEAAEYKICISRKAQFCRGGAAIRIAVDGKPSGKVKAGKSVTINVESGPHTVSFSDWLGREARSYVSLSPQIPCKQLSVKYRLSGEIVIDGGNAAAAPAAAEVVTPPVFPQSQSAAVPMADTISADTDRIIREEQTWRSEQAGLSPIDYELSWVDAMDGPAFEVWCADLLEQSGFVDVRVTPKSGDQGVDITAVKDGVRYAIQCKRYASDLGNTPVQEVSAGKTLYHCQVGAVMTNQHFTPGAKELAEATGTLLWDRDRLIQMMQVAGQ